MMWCIFLMLIHTISGYGISSRYQVQGFRKLNQARLSEGDDDAAENNWVLNVIKLRQPAGLGRSL